MSLSTLHTHRTPFVPATPSSVSAILPCPVESPLPPLSSSASLSSPPPSSSSSPVADMASPTTVYSDRHSLPRAPQPRPLQPCPPPPEHRYHHIFVHENQHQPPPPPQHQPQQHHHHLPLQRPAPPPLSGILADMVPARPKGVVRYPPFEDGQHPVVQRAVQEFRISPFGSIQEYCRHIPYMSNKKTFFDKTRREGFEVFQYVFKLPGDEKEYHVMWDYNIGLVRMTPFFRCCNYGKTAPAKMLNDNPGLRDITHSITGGAIVAQGYWMPYECARAMCATFCYHVAGALVPLFGPDFPSQCIPPHATEFERKVIDPALIAAATRNAELVRQMVVAEGQAGSSGGSNSSSSSSRSETMRPSSGPRAPGPSPSPLLPHRQHPRPESSSSSSGGSGSSSRLNGMPPPSLQPSLRTLRAAMPMLPPPVQVSTRSPVVAPSVAPEYTMPPPWRASPGADGMLPSPVEHKVALPPVSYIASLPPMSPEQSASQQPLPDPYEHPWHLEQCPDRRDHHEPHGQHPDAYHHHHRYYGNAGRAPSPLPAMVRRAREQEILPPLPQYRDDRHRPLPHSPLAAPQIRSPSDSYPSPPQLRSALQQTPPEIEARDDDERARTADRKHRRDSSSGHGGGRHRKRASIAAPRNEGAGSSQRPRSPPRRTTDGSSMVAPGRHRLPGRRVEGGLPLAAASPLTRTAARWARPHPHPSTATDTAAAALLVDFSVNLRARSGSGSGDDCAGDSGDAKDAGPARPRTRVHSIASLLCTNEDN